MCFAIESFFDIRKHHYACCKFARTPATGSRKDHKQVVLYGVVLTNMTLVYLKSITLSH